MIGTRYITKDRKPLETLLPLESPLVLFIDPSDACCLSCNYCPTGDHKLMKQVGRPLKVMDIDSFKKIIDDLQKFETKIKVLRLYTHGEPLLNPNFCEMVSYAKKSNKIETVDTTTNGVLLNKDLNLKLIESGIDRINISVNGINSEQYKTFTNRDVNFGIYVNNIRHLYENRKNTYIFIKICGDVISKEDQQRFLEIFEPIADSVGIEHSMSCWQDFNMKGNVIPNKDVDIYGNELKKEIDVCPYTQYSLVVNSDYSVSLCFLDWSRKLIIDNALENTIYDIWHGNKVREFQTMMLQGKRKDHFYCKKCDQMYRGNPSDIDKFANEILERRNNI